MKTAVTYRFLTNNGPGPTSQSFPSSPLALEFLKFLPFTSFGLLLDLVMDRLICIFLRSHFI